MKQRLEGTIISDKMAKTVVVNVRHIKQHPKYKKRFNVDKKYKAHVESNDFKVGDKVIIETCRPISKDKHWKVVQELNELKAKSENGKTTT